MRQCSDYPAFFIQRHAKSHRCRICQEKANYQCKLRNQRKRNEAKRINEPFDISSAEIDARFTAALKAIRRQPSEGMEPFRSYGWLYREPRS